MSVKAEDTAAPAAAGAAAAEPGAAEEAEPEAGPIQKKVMADILPKIQQKAEAGKKAEADYAEELKAIDELFAAHKAEKNDDVIGLQVLKAQLYMELFEAPEKGIAILKQVKTDFPDSEMAKQLGEAIPQIEAQVAAQAAAAKAQEALKVGNVFPDFKEVDLNGKPFSPSALKGKVVLIDFWATWCGPCVNELPNVIKAYEKYHDKGFEVMGISLDEDKDALTGFIEKKKMPWPQFFDGKGWQNKLAAQFGINSIPATFLLDKEGKIIAKGLRGAALDKEIAKALGLPAEK